MASNARRPNLRIEVENLTQRYEIAKSETEALAGVSVSIEDREFVSILGPSGCGKSTLLRVVAGLIPPSSGTVSFDGQPIAGPPESLGVVFQSDLLLPWRTVLDNVLLQAEIRRLPKRKYIAVARQLLESVGLGGVEDSYPEELSGGMRQRVGICRALLHDPDVLLMDEPYGALDAITRDQMCIDLQKLWMSSPKTVVFVTHAIEEAVFLSDRVLVLTPGPGTVALDLKIDLERPRRIAVRETMEFQDYARQLRAVFERFGILREDV